MRRFTSRTKQRKRAIDTLFEAQQRGFGDNPAKIRELVEQRQLLSAAQTTLPEYAVTAVNGVADNLARIDSLIATYARDWDLDRLAATDLAAMRVAVWEMLANPDVDPRVAIDQAVTIVAMIGTDNSPSFVNGILDRIRQVIATDQETYARVGLSTGMRVEGEANWDMYLEWAEQSETSEAVDDAGAVAQTAASTISDACAAGETDGEDLPEGADPSEDGDFTQSDPQSMVAPAAKSDAVGATRDVEEPPPIAQVTVESIDDSQAAPPRDDERELIERHTIPQWLLDDLQDDYEDA